jgi:chromosome segregation ATPase
MISLLHSGSAASDALTFLKVIELVTDPKAARAALEELEAARKSISDAKADWEAKQRQAVEELKDFDAKKLASELAQAAAAEAAQQAEKDVAKARDAERQAKESLEALDDQLKELQAERRRAEEAKQQASVAAAQAAAALHDAQVEKDKVEAATTALREEAEALEVRIANAKAEIAKLLG